MLEPFSKTQLISPATSVNGSARALQVTVTLPLAKAAFIPYHRSFLLGVATTANVFLSDVAMLEIREVASRGNSKSTSGMQTIAHEGSNDSASGLSLQRSLLAISIEVDTQIIFRSVPGPATSVVSDSGFVSSPGVDEAPSAVAGRVAAASQALLDLHILNANLAASGLPIAATQLALLDKIRPSTAAAPATVPEVIFPSVFAPAAIFVIAVIAVGLIYAWRSTYRAGSLASTSNHVLLEEEA